MSNVITTGGMSAVQEALKEKLSERLKVGFIELIPQEAFDAMTDAAIDEFLHGPRSKRFKSESVYMSKDDERNTTGQNGYVWVEKPFVDEKYNVFADPNTLPGMIYLELVAKVKENLKGIIDGDSRFSQQYDANSGDYVMPIINQIVGDNAVAFIQALMRNVVGYSVAAAINGIRNENGMGGYVPPPPRF